MAFDQDNNNPIIVVRKWTTKTNIGLAVGVLVFFIAGAALIISRHQKHAGDTPLVAPPPANGQAAP